MIHLVSFSYPPDNSPAAHRPLQVARALEEAGETFLLYSRRGIQSHSSPCSLKTGGAAAKPPRRRLQLSLFNMARKVLSPLLEIDFALPWALRTLPRLWLNLAMEHLRTRRRPTVWATSPGVSNANLAVMAGFFSGARIVLDYRDMCMGVERGWMPLLTRGALRTASNLSTVTPELVGYFEKASGGRTVSLVLNGTSSEALDSGRTATIPVGRELTVTYVGALYGGDRPIEAAVKALSDAAKALPALGFDSMRLLLIAREDGLEPLQALTHERFHLEVRPAVPRDEALHRSASSHINLLLIAPHHRCSIPLKAYDLLGVGRPIFYVGPADSEAAVLMKGFPEVSWSEVDPQAFAPDSARLMAELANQGSLPSRPCARVSAVEESKKIVDMLRG